MLKPHHLSPGDTVLVVASSRGGPGAIPHRYEAGKRQLEEEFGVKVIEGKHTLADPQRVYHHPEARAQDLMDGFANPEVKAIISAIGGEESIRILPYVDLEVIRANPKIYMGYSDSTVTHFMCYKAGLTSFYGPSIMSGFAENSGMFEYMVNSVRKICFDNQIIGQITPNMDGWTSERLERGDHNNQSTPRTLQPSTGRRRIQGSGVVEGQLLGGCLDVFPFMVGTSIWPSLDEWRDKILFIETSEEQMNTNQFERIVRNLGSQGILDVISGILLGRPQRNDDSGEQINYDDHLLKIVVGEFGRNDLPIITNMDFGHTDPMMVLPIGCQTKIDCNQQTLAIVDNACI